MSYGQELTKQYFTILTGLAPIENYRPVWLVGLEIDLYWPDLKLAVEFQGDQHYLPVYGINQMATQRKNDRAKRVMIHSRGIVLLQIKAIELEYTIITGKLRRAGRAVRIPMRASNPDKARLKELNHAAVEYRKTLVANFNAPSARRKGDSQRKATNEWLTQNGYQPNPQRKLKRQKKEDRKARAESNKVALVLSQPDSGGIVLDKRTIPRYKSPAGGYNRGTLTALGIAWPGFRGWKRALNGIRISQEKHLEALRAAGRCGP